MKYESERDIELEISASSALLEPSQNPASGNQERPKSSLPKSRWEQSSFGQKLTSLTRHVSSKWQQSSLGRKHKAVARYTSTWRFIVFSGLVITLLVLVVNISVLIWSQARHDGNVLFSGDCTRAKSSITFSSLAINVLSTLLLGASNAAMQCLCAPTRSEVDRVHVTGSWLDIGISGLRNWRAMERWRKYTWGFILASSLPLHLLCVWTSYRCCLKLTRPYRYNSVVFSTSQANDYLALVVSPGYVDGDPLPSTNGSSDFGTRYEDGYATLLSKYYFSSAIPSDPPSLSVPELDLQEVIMIANRLRSNLSTLIRLENADCIRAYNEDFVTAFLNVVLVTDDESYDIAKTKGYEGPLLATYEYHPAPSRNVSTREAILENWLCDGQANCSIGDRIKAPDQWSFTLFSSDPKADQKVQIAYCLAEPVQPQCTVEIFPQILIIVIICNAFKAIAFTTLLAKHNFTPLIILGDAIASFMSDPDPTALSCGPLSSQTVRKAYMADPLRYAVQHHRKHWQQDRSARRVTTWHGAARTWASAVGRRRWIATIFGQEQSHLTAKSHRTLTLLQFPRPLVHRLLFPLQRTAPRRRRQLLHLLDPRLRHPVPARHSQLLPKLPHHRHRPAREPAASRPLFRLSLVQRHGDLHGPQRRIRPPRARAQRSPGLLPAWRPARHVHALAAAQGLDPAARGVGNFALGHVAESVPGQGQRFESLWGDR